MAETTLSWLSLQFYRQSLESASLDELFDAFQESREYILNNFVEKKLTNDSYLVRRHYMIHAELNKRLLQVKQEMLNYLEMNENANKNS